MSGFFLSWQLWEQMTFCLGCAMVIVVCAALLRNTWDWWNLRKHVRILKEQQAEQAQLLRIHPSVRKRQLKSQVPFGVRAIQSGVQVEGVWISRPNSVFNSPSNTSPTSPVPGPERGFGDKLAAASNNEHDHHNSVAGAARELEMQTLGGRTIPPRAARDPFGDSAAASAMSAKSEKSETDSQYNRRSMVESSSYRDMPDEEAGYTAVEAHSSKARSSRRQSQLYQTEYAYESDYFSRPATQPEAYVPIRRTDQRSSTHNTYVPPEAYRPGHDQQAANFGYSYPEGYSQAYVQPDSQVASPVEMDIGEGYGSDAQRPIHQTGVSQSGFDQQPRRENRNSSYLMIFSNQASGAPSGSGRRMTPSPPQDTSDPFATPSAISAPGRSVQQTLLGQAVKMPASGREPRDRAEAEAEASSMRRVNEGFSVARQGQRRDHASLDSAARELHAQAGQRSSAKESDGKTRKKLQKKDRRSDLASERRSSQFKENI